MRSHVLLSLPLALLASCQSMSEGILALEARGIVFEDTELDEGEGGSSFEEEDIDLTGYGAHAALMTPIVDVLGGWDRRDYEDEETDELSLGARRRILEIWRLHPFVEANLRYALDLDNGVDSDDYFGWNAGVGAMLDLTDRLHLSFRVMYETLDVDLPTSGGTDVDGIVGTAGIVLTF